MKKMMISLLVTVMLFSIAFADNGVKGSDYVYDPYEATGLSENEIKLANKAHDDFIAGMEEGTVSEENQFKVSFYMNTDIYVYDWIDIFSDDFYRKDGTIDNAKIVGNSHLYISTISADGHYGKIEYALENGVLDVNDIHNKSFGVSDTLYSEKLLAGSFLLFPKNVQRTINEQLKDEVIKNVRFLFDSTLNINLAYIETESDDYVIVYYGENNTAKFRNNGIEWGTAYKMSDFLEVFDDHFYKKTYSGEEHVIGGDSYGYSAMSLKSKKTEAGSESETAVVTAINTTEEKASKNNTLKVIMAVSGVIAIILAAALVCLNLKKKNSSRSV